MKYLFGCIQFPVLEQQVTYTTKIYMSAQATKKFVVVSAVKMLNPTDEIILKIRNDI